MEIDWDATGSMLAGLGTWAGAFGVVYAAWATFGSWKRQKQEERRIDAAERILTLAYRLQWSLAQLRSRDDYREIHSIPDPAAMGDMTARQFLKHRRLLAHARLAERLKTHQAHWDDIFTLAPVARAFFPEDVFRALLDMRARFDGYCEYLRYYGTTDDEKIATMAEEVIFEPLDPNRPYMDEPPPHDALAERIKEEVAEIEAVLLPVIRYREHLTG